MNPEMQTTLLDTYLPKLIATILKAIRRQLEENDQLNAVEETAGPVPEIPLKYDQILKGEGRFWDDVNSGYLPEDHVLAARREEIEWVHSEGVHEIVPMQECRDASMKPFGLDLGGHRQVLWIRHARKFDRGCVQENTKRRSKVRFNELYPLLKLFPCNATSRSGEGDCLNHDVGEFCQTKGNH